MDLLAYVLSYSGSHRHVKVAFNRDKLLSCCVDATKKRTEGGFITLTLLNKGDLLEVNFAIGG
jgi:hypothetical protein